MATTGFYFILFYFCLLFISLLFVCQYIRLFFVFRFFSLIINYYFFLATCPWLAPLFLLGPLLRVNIYFKILMIKGAVKEKLKGV